jgi:hypothetical protein
MPNRIRLHVSLVMNSQIMDTLGTVEASTHQATSLEFAVFPGQINFPNSLDVPVLLLHNLCYVFVLAA